MIFVQRTQEPERLRRSAAQWLAELQDAIIKLRRVEADPGADDRDRNRAKQAVKKAQGKYAHAGIKDALVRMFHGKCAYCESKVTVVTYGQIEHFYPKGQYIDRTFEWENMLLSCDLCNNSQHKGTRFPLDEDENPLLIDPTTTAPEDHLLFSWDSRAGLASVYGRDTRGQETVQTFDLNGERGRKELLKSRSEHVKTLMALLRIAEGGDEEARSLLVDSCESRSPFAAFAWTHVAPSLRNRI
jgi:uncharacterized protein (TIGR02646 family)